MEGAGAAPKPPNAEGAGDFAPNKDDVAGAPPKILGAGAGLPKAPVAPKAGAGAAPKAGAGVVVLPNKLLPDAGGVAAGAAPKAPPPAGGAPKALVAGDAPMALGAAAGVPKAPPPGVGAGVVKLCTVFAPHVTMVIDLCCCKSVYYGT